jgi:hypothetical protein
MINTDISYGAKEQIRRKEREVERIRRVRQNLENHTTCREIIYLSD